jgi:hypothetical protein
LRLGNAAPRDSLPVMPEYSDGGRGDVRTWFFKLDLLYHIHMIEDTKQKAVLIIKDYLGESTAQLYKNFYENKEELIILASIKELLIEFLGDEQAKQIFIQKGLPNTV